jgi:hypothetical protein
LRLDVSEAPVLGIGSVVMVTARAFEAGAADFPSFEVELGSWSGSLAAPSPSGEFSDESVNV